MKKLLLILLFVPLLFSCGDPELRKEISQEMMDNWYTGKGTFTGESKQKRRIGDKLFRYNYKGQFKDGNFHGQGTMTWDDGKYVGEFKDGDYNGQGTRTWNNGANYVGEWKDSDFHGQGTMIFRTDFGDDAKYVGGWKEGDFHGIGTHTYDGTVTSGKWKNGRLLY